MVTFAVVVVALSAAAQSLDQVAAQAKGGYVTDIAGVLSQSAKSQLTALCTEVDQKAQAQIAVVTIKSLDGRPVTDYSVDLFTRLGVGGKGKDRGVLILVAVNDHQYWTTTGYGLEGILPDGKTGGFGREAVPYLRESNYDAAILLMTRRVADVIAADRGVTLSGSSPAAPRPPTNEFGGSIGSIIGLVIFIFVFGGFFGPILWAIFGRRGPGRRGPWIGGPPIGWGGGGWGGGGFGGSWGGGGGGGGFGGFGGGATGGGGAGGSW